ncbi:hypothetical protein EYV94_00735 [Puteibacter caeruleilacunae]|nr:hypothetical protein EYV94_00735 [Puteibacter caeruleilacunae]
MKIKYGFYGILLILLILSVSCEKELHERYKDPDNLNSTIYKELKNNESFSLFVEALDRLELARSCDGRAALTVFAPDNDAINRWMTANSYNKISDIPLEELSLAVKSHVIENIFNEEQVNQLDYDVVYRLMSLAQKSIVAETQASTGKSFHVYNEKKMMPVFTPTMFAAEKISDPAFNYKYIFGKDYNDRMMFANAKVTEFSIPCTNGYLYHVDDVVTSITNFEDILKEKNDYSLMASMYDRCSSYEYDKAMSEEYVGIADSIFTKTYSNSPEINTEQYGTLLAEKMKASATYFAVKNTVLENYLMQTFFNEKVSAIDDISIISIGFVLKYLSGENLIGWPEKIQGGTFRNNFGSYINFDINSDVDFVNYASNGLVYGLNRMPEITLFSSIMKIPFTDPDYSYFLYAAQFANILDLLVNNRYDYTAFLPKNEDWEDAGIKLDVGDPNLLGDEEFQIWNFNNSRWEGASQAAIRRFVKNHIVKNFTNLTNDMVLAETLNDFGLVFLSNQGVVGGGNQYAGEVAEFTSDETNASNGRYYTTNKVVKLMPYSYGEVMKTNPEFQEFYKLVDKTGGWRKSGGKITGINWLPPNTYNIFIPSNEAILAALEEGKIPVDPDPSLSEEEINDPDISKAVKFEPLVDWLKYYFVGLNGLVRTQFILPTEQFDAGMDTPLVDEENSTNEEDVYHQLHIKFSSEELKIIGKDGDEANVQLDGTALGANALIYKVDHVVSYQ